MRLLPIERVAAVLALILLAGAFASDPLYRATWFLGVLLLMGFWLICALVALPAIFWAFRDYAGGALRLRAAIALPVALVIAPLLSGVAGAAGRWTFGYVHLLRHQAELEAAARARPDGTAAVRYIERIPDGGVALIASPRARPETLDATTQLRLTGERIHQCWRLRSTTYLCSYD